MNIAISCIVDRAPPSFKRSSNAVATAIAILTFTTVVFRAEVLLLLGPVVIQSLLYRYITLKRVVAVGLISGLSSLGKFRPLLLFDPKFTNRIALTISVDSYFWGKSYLWPEFSGLYFNVYEGKSAGWGVNSSTPQKQSRDLNIIFYSADFPGIRLLELSSPKATAILPSSLHHCFLSRLTHPQTPLSIPRVRWPPQLPRP